jgi:hypothetical protein
MTTEISQTEAATVFFSCLGLLLSVLHMGMILVRKSKRNDNGKW